MSELFGTDGIRGIVGKFLTPDFMLKIASGFGYYLRKQGIENPKVVVGYDTRKSGLMLESAFVAGLLSVGIDVIRIGIMPTPAVAFLTKFYNANAGIMITASHNSYDYNGLKVFDKSGYKLTNEEECKIEEIILSNISYEIHTESIGTAIEQFNDSTEIYVNYLKSTGNYNLNGLKVVLDCANGASYDIAPKLFSELGADVIAINNTPNGININNNCGSIDTFKLRQEVLKQNADLGLAFDGDADRLIAVDETGNEVDGDHLLYIYSRYFQKNNLLENKPVVTTIMSNIGLKVALENIGVNICHTSVGDRNVVQEMRKLSSLLGGEPSGHIIFSDYSTTGDGVLAALRLIAITQFENIKLSKLRNSIRKFPQVLYNVEHYGNWEYRSSVKSLVESIKVKLGNKGRVLVRASGSEPLVRVMIEGENQEEIEQYATQIIKIIRKEIASI